MQIDKVFNLKEIYRQANYVPESKRLDILLREFKINKNHMALVVDEYGVVSGFVTIEDIIEQIVGDIEDEFDFEEEAYIKKHGKSFIVKAHMPIDEFNKALNTNFSEKTYDTIGGIVMGELGHLPQRGEKISIANYNFIIINADARRVKLIECRPTQRNDNP